MALNQPVKTLDDGWQSLYKIGGASALVLLAYSLATLVIMVVTGGQPATVEETFRMLQENRLVGLLRLDLLTVFIMPLYYLLFLAFWFSLRRISPVGAMLAMLLVFAGVTLFLATPSVFSYQFLSDRYAAAATDADRARLLAAGEAILASDMWHGTGPMVGGLLMQAGAVLVSVVMLRSRWYSRASAITGIITHGLDLLHVIVGFISPELGMIFMFVAGPLYLVWFPLVARDLYRIAAAGQPAPQASLAGAG